MIREFVKSVMATEYASDKVVQDDWVILNWCTELQAEGQIAIFPTVTIESTIDAVTMCIHIASPQHTSVNSLQNYCYGFTYTEELTVALPIGTDGAKWKDWLLASQLPELLSYKVESRYNLITYAKSLYNVNKDRLGEGKGEYHSDAIAKAAALFHSRLRDLELPFMYVSVT
ncbi:lipoxygenase [Ilyonectria destructans]|nr:lipoxygenase [Ilyonectria destructans]